MGKPGCVSGDNSKSLEGRHSLCFEAVESGSSVSGDPAAAAGMEGSRGRLRVVPAMKHRLASSSASHR